MSHLNGYTIVAIGRELSGPLDVSILAYINSIFKQQPIGMLTIKRKYSEKPVFGFHY
jgi:hypothetical protein